MLFRSTELNEDLASNASVVKAFGIECCEFADGFSVRMEIAFDAFQGWCHRAGIESWADRLTINQFSAKFVAAFSTDGVGRSRPRDGTRERKRVFTGVRLRTK